MDAIRNGSFTSSEIVALTTEGKTKGTFGKPAHTYIEECNYERRLGRGISEESNARPLTWGKLVEKRVHELLPLGYKFSSSESIVHPTIDCWVGSPDGQKFDDGGTVTDIKCPITLKSFCQLVHGVHIGITGDVAMALIRDNHKDGEKYYWQLVSNAILTGSRFAELIVYCPYQSELEAIRELARNYDGPDQSKYRWIDFATDEDLPYLIDGGYYSNLNIIRFEVPRADKDLITQKVLNARGLLIPRLELATD